MHVDVHERRAAASEANVESRLLGGLADGGLPGRFPRIDMSAGLQPQAQQLVPMEHDAPGAGHDRRAGDVRRIGIPLERAREPGQLADYPAPRRRLARVTWHVFDDVAEDASPEIVAYVSSSS